MNTAAILILSALTALFAYSLSRENKNYHKPVLYSISGLLFVGGLVSLFAECLV